jgi:hypothetical protein
MRKRILVLIGVVTLGFASGCHRLQTVPTPGPAPETSVIPRPLKIERRPGRFVLSPGIRIFIPAGEQEIQQVAEYMARRLGASLNCGFEITEMTLAKAAKTSASPSNAFFSIN